MPYHASAKKRLRRDTKKRSQNASCRSELRTLSKKTKKNLQDQDLLIQFQKKADQAVRKGILHKKTASRYVSRMMKMAKSAS